MKISMKIFRLLSVCAFLCSNSALSAVKEDKEVQLLFSKPGYNHGQDFGLRDRCGTTLRRKILAIANGDSIGKASIHIAMYTLTSPGLIKTLKEFSNKGGKVCIVVDDQQLNKTSGTGAKKDMDEKLKILKDETGSKVKLGILGQTSPSFQTLHEKFAVIDDGAGKMELILGSYNWTTNASHNNYENCVLIPSGQENAIEQIKSHFDELWGLSRAYGSEVKDQTCLFRQIPAVGVLPVIPRTLLVAGVSPSLAGVKKEAAREAPAPRTKMGDDRSSAPVVAPSKDRGRSTTQRAKLQSTLREAETSTGTIHPSLEDSPYKEGPRPRARHAPSSASPAVTRSKIGETKETDRKAKSRRRVVESSSDDE